jgi:hypothetical protein
MGERIPAARSRSILRGIRGTDPTITRRSSVDSAPEAADRSSRISNSQPHCASALRVALRAAAVHVSSCSTTILKVRAFPTRRTWCAPSAASPARPMWGSCLFTVATPTHMPCQQTGCCHSRRACLVSLVPPTSDDCWSVGFFSPHQSEWPSRQSVKGETGSLFHTHGLVVIDTIDDRG